MSYINPKINKWRDNDLPLPEKFSSYMINDSKKFMQMYCEKCGYVYEKDQLNGEVFTDVAARRKALEKMFL